MCVPLDRGKEQELVFILKYEDKSMDDYELTCPRDEAIEYWKQREQHYKCWLFEPVSPENVKTFSESEVLRIVDNCFHCYASSFRKDAEQLAQNEMDV